MASLTFSPKQSSIAVEAPSAASHPRRCAAPINPRTRYSRFGSDRIAAATTSSTSTGAVFVFSTGSSITIVSLQDARTLSAGEVFVERLHDEPRVPFLRGGDQGLALRWPAVHPMGDDRAARGAGAGQSRAVS